MLLVGPSFFLLAALVYAAVGIYLRRKRGKSFVFLVFYSIFFFYLVKVIGYTQFPIFLGGSARALGNDGWGHINLVPLVGLGTPDIRTSLLNVLLTIPFGFGLPFIASMRFRGILIAGLIFSASIETLQLLLRLIGNRFPRIIDTNDVVFNTLGVAVGYLAFVALVRVVQIAHRKWNLPPNPILLHIAHRPQVPWAPRGAKIAAVRSP